MTELKKDGIRAAIGERGKRETLKSMDQRMTTRPRSTKRSADDIVVEFIQNFTKLPLDEAAHRELVRIIEAERSPASAAPVVGERGAVIESDGDLFRSLSTVVHGHCKDVQLPQGLDGLTRDLAAWIRSTFAWSFEGEMAMDYQHTTDCAWGRTTSDECEYRDTHYYCPHPEHACTCPPRTKPLKQHLSERLNTANNVLGLLLAASRDEGGAGLQSCVDTLIEIAADRESAGVLYKDVYSPAPAAAATAAPQQPANPDLLSAFKELIKWHHMAAHHDGSADDCKHNHCVGYRKVAKECNTAAPVEQSEHVEAIDCYAPYRTSSSTSARAAAEEIVKAWLWHTPEHDQERARVSVAALIERRLEGAR